MLVYFQGRGDWFFNENPNNKFGPLLAHNFVFKDTETGETESTNEFFRLYDGIDQKRCNEFVGVFKLSNKDIAKYLDSNNFDHVEKLLPCAHECSGFYISLEENDFLRLTKNDFDNCFFLIQKEIDMSCFEHKRVSTIPYVINNKLTAFSDSESKAFDETQAIIERVDPSNSSIIKRTPVTRNTERLEVIHAALDELESKNGKTPTGTETARFMLSKEFQHSSITSRTPRELCLYSGKTLDKDNIKRIYHRTIYPPS